MLWRIGFREMPALLARRRILHGAADEECRRTLDHFLSVRERGMRAQVEGIKLYLLRKRTERLSRFDSLLITLRCGLADDASPSSAL